MKDRNEDTMVDVQDPQAVEVLVSEDGKKLWVNIDGRCRLRAYAIQSLQVDVHGATLVKRKQGVFVTNPEQNPDHLEDDLTPAQSKFVQAVRRAMLPPRDRNTEPLLAWLKHRKNIILSHEHAIATWTVFSQNNAAGWIVFTENTMNAYYDWMMEVI